jgi:hypothetical protein
MRPLIRREDPQSHVTGTAVPCFVCLIHVGNAGALLRSIEPDRHSSFALRLKRGLFLWLGCCLGVQSLAGQSALYWCSVRLDKDPNPSGALIQPLYTGLGVCACCMLRFKPRPCLSTPGLSRSAHASHCLPLRPKLLQEWKMIWLCDLKACWPLKVAGRECHPPRRRVFILSASHTYIKGQQHAKPRVRRCSIAFFIRLLSLACFSHLSSCMGLHMGLFVGSSPSNPFRAVMYCSHPSMRPCSSED